jgi:hypothetical protein
MMVVLGGSGSAAQLFEAQNPIYRMEQQREAELHHQKQNRKSDKKATPLWS